MDYQVWLKEDYQELYRKVECGDLGAAKRELDKAVRAGQEPILTVEVPYSLGIKVEEVGKEVPKKPKGKKEPETTVEEVAEGEATEDKAEPDPSP